MLPRTAAIGILLFACAHRPANDATQPAPAPAAAEPKLPAPEPVSAPEATAPAASPAATAPAARVDFERDLKPIFESRCQPCHFAGGRMYERLPFNKAATIRQLGPKLFTRIKDEDSQKAIRAFLAQPD